MTTPTAQSGHQSYHREGCHLSHIPIIFSSCGCGLAAQSGPSALRARCILADEIQPHYTTTADRLRDPEYPNDRFPLSTQVAIQAIERTLTVLHNMQVQRDEFEARISPPAGARDAVTDEISGVRDTLIVAANNPVSHGGIAGLRRLMHDQAERLRALTGKADVGDVTDAMVEAVECAVGMSAAAWDMVDPKEIIKAARASGWVRGWRKVGGIEVFSITPPSGNGALPEQDFVRYETYLAAATQPAATGAGEAIRLIQMVIPWVSEGSQADLRKVIALVSAMDPAKAPDPIEAAEGFLEIALTAFTERQSIDPSTGYGEYNDRDDEYHADLVSALDAVKGLHDVPPDRRNEDFDHE